MTKKRKNTENGTDDNSETSIQSVASETSILSKHVSDTENIQTKTKSEKDEMIIFNIEIKSIDDLISLGEHRFSGWRLYTNAQMDQSQILFNISKIRFIFVVIRSGRF